MALLKAKMVLQPIRKLCSPTAFEPANKQNSYIHANLFFKSTYSNFTKAELLQLKLIHLFASELLLMKKLEIEKTNSFKS